MDESDGRAAYSDLEYDGTVQDFAFSVKDDGDCICAWDDCSEVVNPDRQEWRSYRMGKT